MRLQLVYSVALFTSIFTLSQSVSFAQQNAVAQNIPVNKSSYKASFDCAKAESKIEKTICSVEDLASEDFMMASIYRSLQASMPPPEINQLKREQLDWLKTREKSCNDAMNIVNCLQGLYVERIATLKKRRRAMNRQPNSLLEKDTPELENERPISSTYERSGISSLKVLGTMYGKLTNKNNKLTAPAIWHGINVPDDLRKYWDATDGEVYIAFEARYKENGTEKYVLVTETRPYGADFYDCHACAPLIGCVVFAKSGDRWVMENQNKYIDVIGKYGWIGNTTRGEDTIELISIGPDRHGILIRGDDMHQGYESYYIYLIVPYQGSLRASLRVGIEGAGSSACEDQATNNAQGVYIAFDKSKKSEYYNVKVRREWNEGLCGNIKSVKEAINYEFVNGIYKEKQ